MIKSVTTNVVIWADNSRFDCDIFNNRAGLTDNPHIKSFREDIPHHIQRESDESLQAYVKHRVEMYCRRHLFEINPDPRFF